MDVFLFNLNVSEELDHLGLGDVTRHAAELDSLRQVVLVQDPLEIHTDAAELVIHERLELSIGKGVEVDEASANVLALLLLLEASRLVLTLEEHGSLASPAASFELADAD